MSTFIFIFIMIFVIYKLYRFWTTTVIYSDPDHTVFNSRIFDIQATYEPGSILPPYPNLWYPVLQSRNLNRGQVKPLFVLEKNLVAYRAKSGKVHVLDAFCPHLGAHLGVGGSVVGNDIRCPFHNWTFNGHGQCTSVPGPIRLPRAQLKSWRSVEKNGWIFIWYHANGQDPTWFPKDFEELRKTKHIRQIETYFNGHLADLLSNTADLDHFDGIHSLAGIISPWQILKKGMFYKIMRKIFYLDFQANWKIGPEAHLAGLTATVTPIILSMPISFLQVKSNAIQCPPVYLITTTVTRFNVSFYMVTSITPISPMRSHWFHEIYSGPGFKSQLFARIAFHAIIPSVSYKAKKVIQKLYDHTQKTQVLF